MTKQEFMAISLPYGLKFLYSIDNSTPELFAIANHGFSLRGNMNLKNGTETRTDIWVSFVKKSEKNLDSIIYFKPILRPYSEITKEITHNGEKVKPYIELLRESSFNVEAMSEKELDYFKSSWSLPELLSLNDAIILISYHFDICGLIEKGEAIDINTLTDFNY